MSIHLFKRARGRCELTGQLWRIGGPKRGMRAALPGTVTVRDPVSGKVIATEKVTPGQAFAIAVPAGNYVLDATSPQIANGNAACQPHTVTAHADTNVRADLYFAVR